MATKSRNRDVSISSEDVLAPQERGTEWGLMFYMAADNNLSDLAATKIDTLRRGGSTETASIIVQFDGSGTSATVRRRIGNGRETADEVEELAEINLGDKKPLIEFIKAGRSSMKPKRSLVVIWNHGFGLDRDEEDGHGGHGILHAAASSRKNRQRSSAARIAQAELAAISPDFATALFPRAVLKGLRKSNDGPLRASVSGAEVRVQAIADDWTSKDHLDNKELQQAMKAVAVDGTIDILAFEACLMNTVEVAYQLRKSVQFIVGSQSNYPQPGWPYSSLHSVFQDPASTTRDVAKAITEAAATVTTGEYLTVSALDLRKVQKLATTISALADAFLEEIASASILDAISYAHLSAQAFADSETVDIIDFCRKLAEFTDHPAILRAADNVEAAAREFIVASRSRGADVENATGISIYFPKRRFISLKYSQLDFAKDTTWLKFLKKYVPKIYPDPFAEVPVDGPQQPAPQPGNGGDHSGHHEH